MIRHSGLNFISALLTGSVNMEGGENMYALQVFENGNWENYPDPLRRTEAEAIEKMNYCLNYRKIHNMKFREYRVVKLDQVGIQKHNTEWNRYVSAID